MNELLGPKHLLWHCLFILGAVLFLSMPYLQAEILTNTFSSEAQDFKNICISKLKVDQAKVKIISYEKGKKTAKVYCLSQNRQNDKEVLFNFTNTWEPVVVENMQEKNSFYWPIYPFRN